MVQDHVEGTVWIGQPVYTENLLVDFQMINAMATKTPVNPGLKLVKASDDTAGVKMELYQSAVVGCCTCLPELVQILLMLSQV